MGFINVFTVGALDTSKVLISINHCNRIGLARNANHKFVVGANSPRTIMYPSTLTAIDQETFRFARLPINCQSHHVVDFCGGLQERVNGRVQYFRSGGGKHDTFIVDKRHVDHCSFWSLPTNIVATLCPEVVAPRRYAKDNVGVE